MAISIHVPAWGTTVFTVVFPLTEQISIHVPAWGTTMPCDKVTNDTNYFNPRSRVGNDHVCHLLPVLLPCISIHVPAWGTTITGYTFYHSYLNFNPRSRVGNDRCISS